MCLCNSSHPALGASAGHPLNDLAMDGMFDAEFVRASDFLLFDEASFGLDYDGFYAAAAPPALEPLGGDSFPLSFFEGLDALDSAAQPSCPALYFIDDADASEPLSASRFSEDPVSRAPSCGPSASAASHPHSHRSAHSASPAPLSGGVSKASSQARITKLHSRISWTPALHDSFLLAVESLGGAERATPMAVLVAMSIKGLHLKHVKSHLQKHRKDLAEGTAIPYSGVYDDASEASQGTDL